MYNIKWNYDKNISIYKSPLKERNGKPWWCLYLIFTNFGRTFRSPILRQTLHYSHIIILNNLLQFNLSYNMFCRTFVYTVRIANKSIPCNYYYVLGSRVAENEEICSVDLLHCYNRLSMEEFPASKYKQTMHCWQYPLY